MSNQLSFYLKYLELLKKDHIIQRFVIFDLTEKRKKIFNQSKSMKNLDQLKKSIALYLLLFGTIVYAQEIEKSIFITGNTWNTSNTEVLSQIALDAKSLQNPMLLILGNAVPEKEFKNSIDKQLQLIKDFKKEAIFVVGNQEWSEVGHKRVKDIEKYIQKNSKAKFYPDDSEPIKHNALGENVVLITVDSQWFLEDWNQDSYINEESEIQNRTLFFLEFENQIKKAQGKIILVAIHHPIETNTKQGLWANTGGFAEGDFQNKQYRKLRSRLKTIARGTDNIIFLSGHDKNLQYLNKQVPQIISGASGALENVKNGGDQQFTTSKKGYVRIDIDSQGKVVANFLVIENGRAQQVFNATILKGGGMMNKWGTYNLKNQFPASQSASVYTKEATIKSGFYKALWGKHYREFYGTNVNAPVILLDTLMGGLSPIKRGGGQQSKSLRLEDKDGKQFVMRALKKVPLNFYRPMLFKKLISATHSTVQLLTSSLLIFTRPPILIPLLQLEG